MRSRKRFLGVVVVLITGITIVLETLSALKGRPLPWTTVLFPYPFIGVVLLLGWYAIKLPSLKADTTKVSVLDGPDTKRMLRSDLGFIFRGQVLRPVRYNSFRDKSYVFAASDGKVWLTPWAESFIDGGVVEFAQRLQVPIRGDFSVKVKDRVDPTGQSEPKPNPG